MYSVCIEFWNNLVNSFESLSIGEDTIITLIQDTVGVHMYNMMFTFFHLFN